MDKVKDVSVYGAIVCGSLRVLSITEFIIAGAGIDDKCLLALTATVRLSRRRGSLFE